MSLWDTASASRMGASTELDLASQGPDGQTSARTIIWVVQVDDNLYVRSAHGASGAWYRRALFAGSGHVWAGGINAAVHLVPVDPADHDLHAAIDAAYHRKYHYYGPRIVGSVTGRPAAEVSLRLEPTA